MDTELEDKGKRHKKRGREIANLNPQFPIQKSGGIIVTSIKIGKSIERAGKEQEKYARELLPCCVWVRRPLRWKGVAGR